MDFYNFYKLLSEAQDGVTRLYRGGRLPKDIDYNNQHIKLAVQENPGLKVVMGCWFTDVLKDAHWYAEDNEQSIHYLDLPTQVAQQYNVVNNSVAKMYSPKGRAGELSEYLLPKELANQAKKLS